MNGNLNGWLVEHGKLFEIFVCVVNVKRLYRSKRLKSFNLLGKVVIVKMLNDIK